MFWPVYDLLMLASCIWVGSLFRRQWLSWAAVVGMAVLQLVDLSPGLLQRSQALDAAQQSEAFPTQMSTNDPFAARYDAKALEQERSELLAELSEGIIQPDTLYLFSEEELFLQTVEEVSETQAWCGRVDGTQGSWYVIAPGMQDAQLDDGCIRYDMNYPLRIADYTDGLWNRGVLDQDRGVVCFVDAPFTRRKLENASFLCAGQSEYPILKVDDSDPGWLMVTLDIEDATVLWDQELETK